MITKPRGTAPGICRELDCAHPWTGFGFCDAHRTALNAALVKHTAAVSALLASPPSRQGSRIRSSHPSARPARPRQTPITPTPTKDPAP